MYRCRRPWMRRARCVSPRRFLLMAAELLRPSTAAGHIAPGSPWQNPHVGSFGGTAR